MITQYSKIIRAVVFVVSATLGFAANAAIVDFRGVAGFVIDGGGIYTGTKEGDAFQGQIDDVTGNGWISNGTIITNFSCCIAAGESGQPVGVGNDETIDADEALVLNSITGTTDFSDGDIFDSIDIEGDMSTPGAGRFEAGVSYLFDEMQFPDDNLANYPFGSTQPLYAGFFIIEENAAGDEIFALAGKLAPVPLPAAIWLFAGALLALTGFTQRRS